VFIIVSTFFLMPIRILGFVRMAHASGWGTRAGAYGGGGENEDLMAELEQVGGGAPVDLVDRTEASSAVRTEVRRVRAAQAAQHPTATRRRLNPLAAVPYGIALALLSLEALAYV